MFDILQHPPTTSERPRAAAGVSLAAHVALIAFAAITTGRAVVEAAPAAESIVETAIKFLLPPDKPPVPSGNDRLTYASQRAGSERASTLAVPNGRPVPMNTGAQGAQNIDGNAPKTLAEEAAAQDAFTLIDVDTVATRDPESAAPAYPASLAAQGIEGVAVVRFVVDTTGRADLESFSVVETNHPLFGDAVRAALPGMKFRPATIGPKKVRQLVELPLAFKLARPVPPTKP